MRRHAVTRKGTKLATPNPERACVSPDTYEQRQSHARGEGVAWVWGRWQLLLGSGAGKFRT